MAEWFGKGCSYFTGVWEDTEETGGPNYKESLPVLVYCKHSNNKDDSEGNCNKDFCPLGYMDHMFINKISFKPIDPLPGTIFGKHKDNIILAIERSGRYCPCQKERVLQTKCPCVQYRLIKECHCNLYVKE